MFASRKNHISRPMSQAARQSKPIFETLEERQHMTATMVTNTLDSGSGSLRAAIQAVNAGKDSVVKFNIPKSSHGYNSSTKTWTISPVSPLPVMEKTVMIDGYSQPGYGSSPVVKINGQGLEFAAPHSTLRGMAVNGASDGVILDLKSYGDVVVGNTITNSEFTGIYIESDQNTIGAVGHINTILNSYSGAGMEVAGNYNTIVKNTVSNANVTIDVLGYGNTLQANTVSESWDGAAISVEGTDNLIGGTSNGDGNTVYGEYVGIDPGSDTNPVVGNSITMQPGGIGIEQDESQAAPVINSAVEYLGKLTVTGTVTGTPYSLTRVELFASTPQSSSATPANDEGEVYLGYVTCVTNGSGIATFSDTLAYGAGGKVITATATANGDSSGFSNAQSTFVLFPILHLPIHLI